MATSISLAWR